MAPAERIQFTQNNIVRPLVGKNARIARRVNPANELVIDINVDVVRNSIPKCRIVLRNG